ncbi:MAG TPA: alpha/beta fold hydrolase [Candidatus Dormibacteraeota bacterium]|nr:alpha/beta fold hydrolase [Candidatus Dormibacteraeota bacterium]
MRGLDEKRLRQYAGTYQWDRNDFVYLQMWSEFTGTNELVAFDDSGEVRTLYPEDRDRFFAGIGAAAPATVESRIEFHRDASGEITSLSWLQEGASRRLARRVEIESREDVYFSSGEIRLAGTLIAPKIGGRRPAVILVHASGAEDREYLLPFAHFLVSQGMAILGYDKRGVGGSDGHWKTASFDDLAADVVAAFEYLRTRNDIDGTQIGLLGWSQAGWVIPVAAVRAKGIAFLISISGAGVPPAETTIDEARNEMTARGMQPQAVDQIVGLMKLEYRFAQSGEGWQEYALARETLAARMGKPPNTFPGTRADPYWEFMRRMYFYDPAPTLRQLRIPTLALFGELDNNILTEKNKAAWQAALQAAGNRDYTLRILPKANHLMLDAKIGNNAEMPSLRRFVPAYFTTVRDWLAKRVRLTRPTLPTAMQGTN